jgi:hypothetical protein
VHPGVLGELQKAAQSAVRPMLAEGGKIIGRACAHEGRSSSRDRNLQVRAAKFMRPSRSGHVFSPEHLRAVRFGLNLAIKGACARPLRISFPKVMAPLFPPAAARAKRNEKK